MWCDGWLRGDGNDGGRVFSLECHAIAPIICSTQVIKRMIEYERRIIHANNLCENGNLSPQNAKMHVAFIFNDKLWLAVNDNQAKKNYDANCTCKYFDCAHFQCILKSTCVAITNLWCILIHLFLDGTYFMVDMTNYERKVVKLPHESNCLMDFLERKIIVNRGYAVISMGGFDSIWSRWPESKYFQ